MIQELWATVRMEGSMEISLHSSWWDEEIGNSFENWMNVLRFFLCSHLYMWINAVYRSKFRPLGVKDRTVRIQWLSFFFLNTASSLWFFSMTMMVQGHQERCGQCCYSRTTFSDVEKKLLILVNCHVSMRLSSKCVHVPASMSQLTPSDAKQMPTLFHANYVFILS